jgi:hypothetical protein
MGENENVLTAKPKMSPGKHSHSVKLGGGGFLTR